MQLKTSSLGNLLHSEAESENFGNSSIDFEWFVNSHQFCIDSANCGRGTPHSSQERS